MFVASADTLLMLMPLAAIAAILLAWQQQRLSALKRENQAQRRALHELEASFQQAPVGLAVLDRDLRVLRINQLLADLNGLPVEDQIGKSIHDVLPDAAAVDDTPLRRVVHTGEPVTGLVFHRATAAEPGGRHTWREGAYPVFGRDGELLGVSVVVEDITDQQRLMNALRDSEQRERRRVAELEGVLEAAPVAVFIANDRACLDVTGNAAARRLLRLRPGEKLAGLRAFDVLADGIPVDHRLLPLHRAAAVGEESWGTRLSIRFRNGDLLHIVVNAVPLRDDTGQVVGAAAAFIDAGAHEVVV